MGRLVGRTDCKSFGTSAAGAAAAPASNRECVEYDYDGRGLLKPEARQRRVQLLPGDDLRDGRGLERRHPDQRKGIVLALRLHLPLRRRLRDRRPCRRGLADLCRRALSARRGPSLEFLVDLRQASSGSYCVERTRYPWGI
ncbi:MAG: hypothetical protein MZU91_10765 [Desulfosudis oleivorans]|nr:hypothetical protein [Desulfosudis oleivorans]